MTHAIYKFGSIVLPYRMVADDLSSGDVESSLIDSVGGTFDYWGSAQRFPRRRRLAFRGISAGELTYSSGWSENTANFRLAVDTLKAAVGSRASLYRLRDDDSAEQWITARLLYVHYTRKLNDIGIAPLELLFESAMPGWHSSTKTTKSQACTAGTNNATVANGGLIPVHDAVFTYTGTSAASTVRVRITAMGVDWTYNAIVGAADVLVVNAGTQTVTLNAVDAYGDFMLNAGHTAETWMPLAVGNNTVAITVGGIGTGTAVVEHYNQWL